MTYKTDALGNVLAHKPGRRGSTTVMVAAHMDEVGLMVVGIEDSGLLRFKPIGGIDRRVLVCQAGFGWSEKDPLG